MDATSANAGGVSACTCWPALGHILANNCAGGWEAVCSARLRTGGSPSGEEREQAFGVGKTASSLCCNARFCQVFAWSLGPVSNLFRS